MFGAKAEAKDRKSQSSSTVASYLISPRSADYADQKENAARLKWLLQQDHQILLIPQTAIQQKVSLIGDRNILLNSISQLVSKLKKIKVTVDSNKNKKPDELEKLIQQQITSIKARHHGTPHWPTLPHINNIKTPSPVNNTIAALLHDFFKSPLITQLNATKAPIKIFVLGNKPADKPSPENVIYVTDEKELADIIYKKHIAPNADKTKYCFIYPIEKTPIVLKRIIPDEKTEQKLNENLKKNKNNKEYLALVKRLATGRTINALTKELVKFLGDLQIADGTANTMEDLYQLCEKNIFGTLPVSEPTKQALKELFFDYINKLIQRTEESIKAYFDTEFTQLVMGRMVGPEYYPLSPDAEAIFAQSEKLCLPDEKTTSLYPVLGFPRDLKPDPTTELGSPKPMPLPTTQHVFFAAMTIKVAVEKPLTPHVAVHHCLLHNN